MNQGSTWDVIIVGGGQAGLAMGYHLRGMGLRYVMLDGGPAAGHSWRSRWDSLRLFTPASHSGLPGLRFPLPFWQKPTKDQVADYLAAYIDHFDLPVRFNHPVTHLRAAPEGGYHLVTPHGDFHARQVVISTGPHQGPIRPPFAADLGPGVQQLHSCEYKNPAQLADGPAVVVGGANSGAQIAVELLRTRPVALCRLEELPYVPALLTTSFGYWWAELSGLMRLTIDTPKGQQRSRYDAVYGINLEHLAQHKGLRLLPAAIAAEPGALICADGQRAEARCVIWATGFRPDYGWIDVPVFNRQGRPRHRRGITDAPGLYFLGLEWLWTRGSALIGWVGRDAAYLARQIKVRAALGQGQ